jgi:hypothetical protein
MLVARKTLLISTGLRLIWIGILMKDVGAAKQILGIEVFIDGKNVRRLIIAMECSNISHIVGVVSRHMEKSGKEHGSGCFDI